MIPNESMQIKLSKQFTKQYCKASQKIQIAFDKRLLVFRQNQVHPSLRNHQLKGKFSGYRSINITGDWRALYYETENGEVIFFDFIGTHSQLY